MAPHDSDDERGESEEEEVAGGSYGLGYNLLAADGDECQHATDDDDDDDAHEDDASDANPNLDQDTMSRTTLRTQLEPEPLSNGLSSLQDDSERPENMLNRRSSAEAGARTENRAEPSHSAANIDNVMEVGNNVASIASVPFATGGSQCSPSSQPVENGEEKWSEESGREAAFDSSDEEERLRVEAEQAERDALEADARRRSALLSDENRAAIISAMRGVTLQGFTPDWARMLPEEEWRRPLAERRS